tara:strand:+ start:409 stop:876 length:468 start_codon:yes stop_codon:yes gene_type:complete
VRGADTYEHSPHKVGPAVEYGLFPDPPYPIPNDAFEVGTNGEIVDEGTKLEMLAYINDDPFTVSHVEVEVEIDHPYPGDLRMWVESPHGTEVVFTKTYGITRTATSSKVRQSSNLVDCICTFKNNLWVFYLLRFKSSAIYVYSFSIRTCQQYELR